MSNDATFFNKSVNTKSSNGLRLHYFTPKLKKWRDPPDHKARKVPFLHPGLPGTFSLCLAEKAVSAVMPGEKCSTSYC